MFCAPGLVFGCTEGVGSRFHVLRSRNGFRQCQVCRVPFSYFALSKSFLLVPRASGPIFMICASGLIFGGTEGVGSRFHVLHSRIRFGRYEGRQVPFSCFALPDSFTAVPRASGPIFMFCALGIVFGGTEGVGSFFHVLRSRTRFRRYRGRRDTFSCFALTDSFSAVPRASDPVFMFCAPVFVFVGTEGVGSRFRVLLSQNRFRRGRGILFHVLLSRTHFQWCRVRRVPYSFFALPDSFSAVLRASGPIFIFCAPGIVFCGADCVRSRLYILRSRTHFRRYRGLRVPFSSFSLPDSFSAVLRASGPIFCFCAPGIFFGDAECVGCRFHVLRYRNRFRRCRVCWVPFSCFALPDSFSVVPRASGPVFMFCAPGLIFSGTEDVESRFHVLHFRNRFRRYLVRRIPFSCFALLNSFSAVPRAWGPIFMFCIPELVFGGTEGIGSLFHVLRSRNRFRRYRGDGSVFLVLRSRTRFRWY
jgi:hypothetical protein